MTVDGSQLDYVDSPLVHIGAAQSFAVGNLDLSFDATESEQTAADSWRHSGDPDSSAHVEPPPSSADDEEAQWDWDWELDDIDSNQDSAAIGTHEEAEVLSDDPSLTTPANGEERRLVTPAQKDVHDAAPRPVGNGQDSNAQGRQRTRTRNRRRRSRLR
jgi:hypothetical protein